VTPQIKNFIPLLRDAIADAKAAGFDTDAHELEQAVFSAFTTSSEMLQEQDRAINRFLKSTRTTLPRPIRIKLETCLTETELATSGWRKLAARLKRFRTSIP
jgi:hypothetical protein